MNILTFRRLLMVLALASLPLMSSNTFSSEEEQKPTLLILGTAHFQNIGRDQINIQIEDLSSPSRQVQIDNLIELLKKFEPTHIAVEFPARAQDQVDEAYNSYLEGTSDLRVIEQHQIGYRLGKALQLGRIYAIDWNDYPPGDIEDYDWVKFGQENGLQSEVEALSDPTNLPPIHDVSGQTVTEWLLRINSPDILSEMHRMYYDIARISKGEDHPGADWVGTWYARNLKIINNIHEIVDSPDSRVLVIYGLGHAYLLNQIAIESGSFDVVRPLEVLK